jgi:hypothetical protein
MAKKGMMIDGIIINNTNNPTTITIQEVNQSVSSAVKRDELNESNFYINPMTNQVSIKEEGIGESELSTSVQDKLNLWESIEDVVHPEDSRYKMKDEFDLDMANRKIIDTREIDLTVDLVTHLYKEGRIFYDKSVGRVCYYNDKADVTIEIGSESIIRVINNTGATIVSGTPVYPSGVYSGITTIAKANCVDYKKSRLIGITTMDILNGEEGEVTKFGKVCGVDTSSFNDGDILYLDCSDGGITNIEPTGESYIATLGVCQVSDSSNGIIMVDVTTTHLTVEVTDTNGFAPTFQGDNLIMNFDNRVFTITLDPAFEYFSFYQNGIKYRKYNGDTITINDVEGLHGIYYDLGVLKSIENPTDEEVIDLLLNKCIVCYIYWDATSKSLVHFANEKHGISMSPSTHVNLHMTRGTQLLYGLGLGDITPDQNGSAEDYWQYSVSSGSILDEDIETEIQSYSKTTQINTFYLYGDEFIRRSTSDRLINDGGTGLICYNRINPTTLDWELVSASSGDYILYHVFATNSYYDNLKIISIVGHNAYPKLTDAKEGAAGEVSNIMDLLNIEEKIPIGTLIIYTKSNYTNSKKAVIVSTPDGDPYIDWRSTEIIQGINPSSHDNLTNVNNVGSGITKGHISDQAESIYGVKTFIDGIVTPSEIKTKTFESGTTTLDTTLASAGDGVIYQIKAKNTTGDIKIGEIYICYSSVNGVSIISNLTGFGDVVFDAVDNASSFSLTATTVVDNWTLSYIKKIF